MGIIWTILIGFVAGLLARAVLPGNQSMGFFLTAVLGIVGSLLATYLGQAMGWYTAGAGAGFLASVIGAVVVLVIYGMVMRKRA
ncbi:MAG: GlsB/YeaQ/YmgE family stress response membrane protein [Bdellovibrionales bacterium]|nr:GlsB/YeaQ/YmgE family stress response membrane protein [Ramlibacter sp.]